MVIVNEEKCVGCGICVCICPVDALSGLGNVKLNQKLCTQCLECIAACPVSALGVK